VEFEIFQKPLKLTRFQISGELFSLSLVERNSGEEEGEQNVNMRGERGKKKKRGISQYRRRRRRRKKTEPGESERRGDAQEKDEREFEHLRRCFSCGGVGEQLWFGGEKGKKENSKETSLEGNCPFFGPSFFGFVGCSSLTPPPIGEFIQSIEPDSIRLKRGICQNAQRHTYSGWGKKKKKKNNTKR
jgi:hypothetical protein